MEEQINKLAEMRDELVGAMIGLAKSCQNNPKTENTDSVIIEGLFLSARNTDSNQETLQAMIDKVNKEKDIIVPNCKHCQSPCGNTSNYDMNEIWNAPEDIRSAKSKLLVISQELAKYAYQAMEQGYENEEVNYFFHKALCMLGYDLEEEHLLPVIKEAQEYLEQCEVE